MCVYVCVCMYDHRIPVALVLVMVFTGGVITGGSTWDVPFATTIQVVAELIPFLWCASFANLAVSSVRGRVEQSRSVLELAPTATISPLWEKATDRTTWRIGIIVHRAR